MLSCTTNACYLRALCCPAAVMMSDNMFLDEEVHYVRLLNNHTFECMLCDFHWRCNAFALLNARKPQIQIQSSVLFGCTPGVGTLWNAVLQQLKWFRFRFGPWGTGWCIFISGNGTGPPADGGFPISVFSR